MPQLIHPQMVKILTKEGECLVNITLDLNINLNSGDINVTAKQKEIEEEEEVNWAIPTFASEKKIKFGKKEGE